MKNMGVINGGISTLHDDFFARRTSCRSYHILIITVAGEGEFLMEDGTEVISRPGDMFFSNASGQGHIHRPHGKEAWEILWLQLSADASWFVPPTSDWQITKCMSLPKLHYCLDSILYEDLWNENESSQVKNLQAELFFIYLRREIDNFSEWGRYINYRTKFNQLWSEVASSLDKPWNLDMLCSYMGVGRAHLSRLCQLFYKTSPAEKVKGIKMEHARALLLNFECPVSEVAEFVGYDNFSTFSTAFHKYFGYSPREAMKLRESKKS